MTNGDSIVLERWEYALSAQGPYVPKEIRKAGATLTAAARLERAMKRLEDGNAKPQEWDLVRDGVYELRVQADKRWYRLLFGRCGDRFIALHFVVKKQNKLSATAISTAVQRLQQHC